ncbi:MAG: hypothetical protein KF830_18735, partial [Planctomycetes bacterium]|nr:hypothetical protein [Planctomycetota bacterium]
MFRRSIQILLATTLLALAAIVAYAALRLSGPGEALAQAQELLQQGQAARAVALLDLCERGASLQADPALRERLWRLRLEANTRLDNPRGALLDVENLQREYPDDPELQLERIRLAIATGDLERARQLARAFVGRNPDHARGLELAGAACAAAWQREVETQSAALQRDVGLAAAAEAQAAFATFVFRPDGDAEVAQASDALAALHAGDVRLAAAWASRIASLRPLREAVQEGLDYCRRSLAAGGTPGPAAAIWAAALAAGGRSDDMLVATEIHRRRPPDAASTGVALAAALALLRRGADAAVVATAERWLPSGLLQPRLDAGTLGDAAPDLLLARGLAAWRLGDAQALRRTVADLAVLWRAGVRQPLAQHTIAGLAHAVNYRANGNELEARNGENNLRLVATLLLRQGPREDWPNLLDIVMPVRLEMLAAQADGEAERLAVFQEWLKARPEALAPRLSFARHLLAQRKLPAAAAVLEEAALRHGADEALFDLRVELARAEGERDGQDGAALLAQCVRRQTATPNVAQPIGYLLCAEAALAAKVFGVARESAMLGARAFPQQRRPRLLAIEAALGARQATLAAEQVQGLLPLFPVDAATAQLALRAYREAGLPATSLLATVWPACPPGPDVRTELLRAALADDPAAALAFALPVPADPGAPPALRLLAAQALARAGRPADARRLFEGVLGEADALRATAPTDLAQALTAWVGAAARFRDDASLAPDLARMLARKGLRDEATASVLLEAAAALAATHAATAQVLAGHAVAIAAPAGRNGAVFALLGRLALRLQQLRAAEEHWLAALAFADGHAAAADLAR